MSNVFFGHMHIHYNSVEGGIHHFYSPTYKGLLSNMIAYLVKEKLIKADEWKISFSNALDFITDGKGCLASVGGSSDIDSLTDLLDDAGSDNLDDGGWFEYSPPDNCEIDPEKTLVMDISYNFNFDTDGYDNAYKTFIGSDIYHLERKFKSWLEGLVQDQLSGTTKELVDFLNHNYPDDGNSCGGINIRYRITKAVSEEFIEGDNLI